MKKLLKWEVRLVSLGLCLALLMGGLSVAAIAEKSDVESISKAELTDVLWEPTVEETPGLMAGDLTLDELSSKKLSFEDVPEAVFGEAIEEKGHVNRLREQEEDLNTVIFQNRDGTKTMYYFDEPTKYEDENGDIRDKRTIMTDVINKPEYVHNYAFVTDENDVKVYFPKTLNQSTGVILEKDNIKIEMSPVSGKKNTLLDTTIQPLIPNSEIRNLSKSNSISNSFSDMQQLETIATPAVAQKNSIASETERVKEFVQFDSVFGADTEIRYTPQFSGFKEDIILQSYTGINEFTFRLKTGGLTLLMAEGGEYNLVDPLTKDIVASLSDLVVYDSCEPETSEPLDIQEKTSERPELPELTEEELNALYFPEPTSYIGYRHYYQAETVSADEEYLLTLVVDKNYLTDENTVYPVIVDPTINIRASTNSSYIHDATIFSNYNTKAGSSGSLFVGNYNAAYPAYSYGVARTLVKFPGLFNNNTFKDLETVRIDKVEYIPRDIMCNSNQVWVQLCFATQAWTESSVVYNNSIWNAYEGPVTEQFVYYNNGKANWDGSGGSGNFYSFDITYLVESWKKELYGGMFDHYGLMLKAWNENDKAVTFASSEHSTASYRPSLILTYNTLTYINSISLPSNLTLDKNQTSTLQVTFNPSNPTYKGITWSSNNTNIATVSSSGLVCAKNAGTATITAKSTWDNTKIATCTVKVNKKAIIIVPGIMGSEIVATGAFSLNGYSVSNGQVLFPPDQLGFTNMEHRMTALRMSNATTPQYATGVPAPIINEPSSSAKHFGSKVSGVYAYEALYEKMYATYYPQYDIVLYQYDWRKSPAVTANALSNFIDNQGKYDKISFVAHSMGGLVTSSYLAQYPQYRSKIIRNLSINTPYLGAVKVFKNIDDGRFIDMMWLIDKFVLAPIQFWAAARDVMPTFASTYILMPPSQQYEPYAKFKYTNNQTAWTTYPTNTQTMSELNYYLSNNNTWSSSLIADAQTFHSSLCVNGAHVTTLVDSYYIFGRKSNNTIDKVQIWPYWKDGVYGVEYADGDNTVTERSATINYTLPTARLIRKEASFCTGSMQTGHLEMIQGSSYSFLGNLEWTDLSTVNFIPFVLNGNYSSFSAQTRNSYGFA